MPPKAKKGCPGGVMSLTVLSRVRVSPAQQVPARGQALCTEGFKLPANNGDRGPGSMEAPQVPVSSVPSVNGWGGGSQPGF